MNLLIVDDTTEITDMVSQYMQLKGHQCDVSNDGKNGSSLIQNNSFDCIILDLAMPGFSGFDVLEELTQNDKISSNTIVVLTAVPISENEEKLLQRYGVKEILKKPVKMNNLLQIIETVVRG